MSSPRRRSDAANATTIADPEADTTIEKDSRLESRISNKIEESLDSDLAAGAEVGEYEVQNKLGAGGFGTVYRAVHPLIGKTAAVKVLNREFSSNAEMVSRFIAEARAANTIGHSHIIDIFAFGTLDDGRHYYVMELLEGASLEQFISNNGAIDPAMTIQILKPVARALDAAHSKSIVHRDLKPDNIFLSFDDDGHPIPKLLDFGIAKLMGDNAMSSGHKTRTGTPVGTPHYMSPEQCLGQSVDHRCDVYAFGVVCFEMLTGTAPFDGNSFLELMHKQANAERPNASDVMPGLGNHFDDAIKTLMHRDREQRPDSLATAMDRLLAAAAAAGFDVDQRSTVPASRRRAAPTDHSEGAAEFSGIAEKRAADASSTVGAEVPSSTVPPSSATRGLVITATAIALCIGAYLLMDAAGSDPAATSEPVAAHDSTAAVPPANAPTTAPTSTVEGTATDLGKTVSLAVHSTHTGKVFVRTVDGTERAIGSTPGSFELAASDAEATLVWRAAGCSELTKKIRLDKSSLVQLKPTCTTAAKKQPAQSGRATPSPPAPPSKPPAASDTPEEFESPFE